MVKDCTYVNATEASELGLPLKYGDVVGHKTFLNYLKHKKTGKIYERFLGSEALKNRTATAKRKRNAIKNFRDRVKMFKGCAQCGYKKHPAALHFNHIDPTKKIGDVSKMKTWETVKREMRKCEVLCANCHAIKTVSEKHYLNEGNT